MRYQNDPTNAQERAGWRHGITIPKSRGHNHPTPEQAAAGAIRRRIEELENQEEDDLWT